jgi:hypothetical protein
MRATFEKSTLLNGYFTFMQNKPDLQLPGVSGTATGCFDPGAGIPGARKPQSYETGFGMIVFGSPVLPYPVFLPDP